MKKSERLAKIAVIVETQERRAAKEVGESQRVVDERKARLRELENYRDEYISGFQAKIGEMLNVSQLNEYRSFTSKLNSAVEQQKQLLLQSQMVLEEKKRQWSAIRNRYKSMEKVIESRRNQEILDENRRQQKEVDERGRSVRL